MKSINIWLYSWAIFLALGWLMPNHYPPWLGFHADLWIAFSFLVAAFVIIFLNQGKVELHGLTIVAGLVALIPFVQYELRLIPFSGQAWMGTIFVLGFCLAMALGASWENFKPGQAADGLFFAVTVAGVISVGIQLYQWLNLSLESMDLWIVGVPHSRPFANFAQPNQLATFLQWSLLGLIWAVVRGQLRKPVFLLAACYLLFGIVLTQSRTAILGMICMVIIAIYHRNSISWKNSISTFLLLGAYFFCCIIFLPDLNNYLGIDSGPSLIERSKTELRIPAYMMLIDAIQQKPLWGYGWGRTSAAHLAVADHHPMMGGIFSQAHNIFLDIVIWLGIPLGLMLSLVLLTWILRAFKKISNPNDLILFLFLIAVAVHAMLELPLHYASMLLPFGLIIGIMNVRQDNPVIYSIKKLYFIFILLATLILLFFIARDYFRVEENFRAFRFERARIGATPVKPMFKIHLLDHMDEFILAGRTVAEPNMSAADISRLERATQGYPSPANFYTLALALALNHRAQDADSLLKRVVRVVSTDDLAVMKRLWTQASQKHAVLQAIPWPE